MKSKALASGFIAAMMALGTLPASAAFINGSITMSGDFVPTGGATLADATGIDFLGDDFGVDGATEDFALAGISAGDSGSITDFTFSGSPAAFDLWTIGGFTFNMDQVNIVFQNSWFLILSGSGSISGNGFFETNGTWNLTANTGGSLFNFSSGATAPEPGTLALMALGGLGFLAGRRRRS